MTHFPEKRAVLLPLLHDVQDHAGCLTRDGMRWVAEFTGITPVEVWGVASFYWMYDFEPRAKWRIAVCHNISCDLRGKDAFVLYQKLCAATGQRQDPCVLDTFMAVTDFMRGAPAAPWWNYTAQRKALFGPV